MVESEILAMDMRLLDEAAQAEKCGFRARSREWDRLTHVLRELRDARCRELAKNINSM